MIISAPGLADWGPFHGLYDPSNARHMVNYGNDLAYCSSAGVNCSTEEVDHPDGQPRLQVWRDTAPPVPSGDCASNPGGVTCRHPTNNQECPATPNPIVLSSGRKYLVIDDVPSHRADGVSFQRLYNYYPSPARPASSYRDLWNIDRAASPYPGNDDEVESQFVGSNANAQSAIDMSLNRELHQIDQLESLIEAGALPGRLVALHLAKEYLTVRHGGKSYTVTIDAGSTTGTVTDPLADFGLTRQAREYDEDGLLTQGASYELTAADGTIFRYSLHGQLVQQAFATGNWISYAYGSNAYGTMDRSWTDRFGRSLTLTYSNADHVILTDSAGLVYHYLFDDPTQANPRLTVIHPDATPGDLSDNDTTEYEHISAFDGDGKPTLLNGALKAIYHNGELVLSYDYDPLTGFPVRSERPDGQDVQQIAFTVDPNNTSQATSATHTNPLGKQTTYHFDWDAGANRLVQVEGLASDNCAASNSTMTYDANGFIETLTDENGTVTNYVHDGRGRETSRTEASGTSEERTTTTQWHPTLRAPTQITEPDRVIGFTYDASGQVLTRTESPR